MIRNFLFLLLLAVATAGCTTVTKDLLSPVRNSKSGTATTLVDLDLDGRNDCLMLLRDSNKTKLIALINRDSGHVAYTMTEVEAEQFRVSHIFRDEHYSGLDEQFEPLTRNQPTVYIVVSCYIDGVALDAYYWDGSGFRYTRIATCAH